MKEKQKGITLIALVITIIVLLILAGVSIATLTGQNGVLSQANNAKEETNSASDLEQVKLGVTVGVSENLTSGKNINEAIQEELRKTDTNATVIGKDDEKDITYNNKNYKVNIKTGSVTENIVDQTGIFTYTADGYITGLKEAYYYWEDTETSSENRKIASLSNIQVAAISAPKYRFLIDEIGTTLYIPSKIENITIKGIKANALSAIANLEAVVLPDTIEEIGDKSFYFCSSLKEVDIKEGVSKFGESAFAFCNINSIYIPDTTKEIGSNCFENCFQAEQMERLFIPIGVEKMGEGVFAGMNYMREKTIYCEASAKPEGWSEDWVTTNSSLIWPNIEWGSSRNG